MKHITTVSSGENISLDTFYKTSVESLGIPEKERKLYRLFVEERRYLIEHLWASFLAEETTRTKNDWEPVMWIKIRETSLSSRAKNILWRYDVILVGHLVQLTRKELLEFRSLGLCTLNEITKYLDSIGLELASD